MVSRHAELIDCVSLRVGHRGRAILPPIDLAIRPGQFWAVIGRNGSGKTTLFRTLLGLQPPVSGTVMRGRGARLSYLAQRAAFDELFPLLGYDIVKMGVERDASFMHPFLSKPAVIRRALDQLGALELARKPFRTLSEGQKQRILLARIAASEPDLALLDEPTAAMDLVAEHSAFEFLDTLRRERGTTVMVVSHYIDVTRAFADHAILLDKESDTALVGTMEDVLAHVSFRRSHFPPERMKEAPRGSKGHVS